MKPVLFCADAERSEHLEVARVGPYESLPDRSIGGEVESGEWRDQMPRLLEVQARQDHRLWLRYDDGAEGEIDLSDVAGRGIFEPLREETAFARVRVGPSGQIAWSPELELCSDAMYLRLTGKSPEQVFPGLRGAATGA